MPQRQPGETNTPHQPQRETERLGFDPDRTIETVTKVARENPHAALAAAVATGFVLGGGVTPRLVGAIAMFAARHYLRATVEETIASFQTHETPARTRP